MVSPAEIRKKIHTITIYGEKYFPSAATYWLLYGYVDVSSESPIGVKKTYSWAYCIGTRVRISARRRLNASTGVSTATCWRSLSVQRWVVWSPNSTSSPLSTTRTSPTATPTMIPTSGTKSPQWTPSSQASNWCCRFFEKFTTLWTTNSWNFHYHAVDYSLFKWFIIFSVNIFMFAH